jgi:serine/threonine protein kinase
MDVEAGVMHVNGNHHDGKYYSSDMDMSASDVYKSELRAQQHQHQQYNQQQLQQQQSERAMRAASIKSQPVPLSLLEPSDVANGSGGAPTMINTTGPLAAGVSVVTGGAVVAAAATASVMTGGARSTGASPTKSRTNTATRSQRSTISEAAMGMPSAAMPAASTITQEEQDHNDALLTWIGGQLSKEKEIELQQQGGNAIQKVPTLASRQQEGTNTTKPSPSRARFDDVSAYAIDFDTLHMGRNIGEGSFGKVYLAVWNETPVAVKVLVDTSSALDRKLDDPMRLRRLAAPVLDKLAEEAGLMASMRHPNIVQFMGIVSMPPCVVTEFCERGSLTDVLKRARKGESGAVEALGWRLRLNMAADAAKGMLYLHARPQPIIHRDLKSPNLLVDGHFHIKICDFNMSRIMEESGQGSSLAGTNPRWLAPELLSGEHATIYSDVFAFGVVLWELLTWELPWLKDNPWSVAHTVGNGGRLTIPNRWDLPGLDTNQFTRLDDYIDLMQRCWAQNPYDRPGFSEIIQELKSLEGSMPEIVYEADYRMSPAPSSGGGSFSRAYSNQQVNVPAPPSSTVPSAPSTAANGGGGGAAGVINLASYPEYQNEIGDDGGMYGDDDVTASMSSTAVAASIDHTGSLPQWQSRQGWGSRPTGQ